jgi:hypothetical protein
MTLPNGAEAVLAARKRGLKPNEMLIVSLVGKVNESNHVIYANQGAEYDWRWLRGLKACLYINQKSNWRPVIEAMVRQRPEWLGLYNVDQFKGATASYLPRADDIEKPTNQWRYVLDFLPWTAWQNNEFAWAE